MAVHCARLLAGVRDASFSSGAGTRPPGTGALAFGEKRKPAVSSGGGSDSPLS